MKFKWINKQNNKQLIVFFNGWAMNETAVQNLVSENIDILMINDYRDFNINFSQFNFEKYEKKYLICWSMGVYAVNLFKNIFENFDKKIAINGTNKMIDDKFGIPKRIYKATVKFLNEDSCDKFIKNMFNNGKLNPQIKITKSLEELKEELTAIQTIEIIDELKFDKTVISNDDRIVPTENQINFWKDRTKIIRINSTHCPFEMFKSWKEILCLN